MEKERLCYLLEQHLAGKATEQEQQELPALLQANTSVLAQRIDALITAHYQKKMAFTKYL